MGYGRTSEFIACNLDEQKVDKGGFSSDKNKTFDALGGADVLEDFIGNLSPDLISILLKDHTTSTDDCQKNIFWATDDYESLGGEYAYHSQILPHLITGGNGHIIMPRTLKHKSKQAERSREMAEVFTPSWVCNLQNNQVDEAWFGRSDVFNRELPDHTWEPTAEKITFPEGKTWRDYVRDTRLEITCGEAPYLVSRYDTTTGEELPMNKRVGLLDRKLRVVSENTETSEEWLKWAQIAYKSIYGFEWQGDNLLIARENLLMTFADYYHAKFGCMPFLRSMQYIAYIISWNVWQMDGLKGVVPHSCGTKRSAQLRLFGEPELCPCRGCLNGDIKQHNGTYCTIRDWTAKKKVRFIDLINS